jgi:hypothetical protein
MRQTLVFLAGILLFASVGLWCWQSDYRNGVVSVKADTGGARSLVHWIPVRESPNDGFQVMELQSGKAIGELTSLKEAPRVVGVSVTTIVYIVQAPGNRASGLQLVRISDPPEQTGEDRRSVVPLAAQPAARVRPAVIPAVVYSPHAAAPKHVSGELTLDANICVEFRHLGCDY